LRIVNRAHTVADFMHGVNICQHAGLRVCAHVILGMPGATVEMERRTADLLRDLKVWGLKLHAFHVLSGTAMAKDYLAGKFTVLSEEEHAARVVDFLIRTPATTVIHRVTGEAPKQYTLAPLWTNNKMAAYDTVLRLFNERNAVQGQWEHGL
jgi:radical SAM protein (TIGR01212 family)